MNFLTKGFEIVSLFPIVFGGINVFLKCILIAVILKPVFK